MNCQFSKIVIPENFYQALDKTYQIHFDELLEKLSSCNCKLEALRYLLNFSSKFLMPKECWEMIVRFEFAVNPKTKKILAQQACSQYFFSQSLGKFHSATHDLKKNLIFFGIRYNDFFQCRKDLGDYLKFPHSHLTECLHSLESQSTKPLSQNILQMYKTNKMFYQKIILNERDTEEWFKCLCEASDANNFDRDIVVQNVEYRLGTDLTNKKLWKMYLQFLRKHDHKKMLELYSNYCRFFLNDCKMLEKYEEDVKNYGPVFPKFFRRLFPFESNYRTYNIELHNYKRNCSNVSFEKLNQEDNTDVISTLCKNFFQNYQEIQQNLSFRNTYITYISEKANSALVRKLHSCCKHWIVHKPFLFIHRICGNQHIQNMTFKDESLRIGKNLAEIEQLQKIWITKVFDAAEMSHSILSLLMPKLYRCDAKYIYLRCELSVDETKFLIKSGEVVVFKWHRLMHKGAICKHHFISNEIEKRIMTVNHLSFQNNKNCLALEDVMQYMPKLEKFEMLPVCFTEQTITKLLNQKFSSKIYSLSLSDIQGSVFCPSEFIEFDKKIRGKPFALKLIFNPTLYHLANHVQKTLQNYFDKEEEHNIIIKI